MTKSTITENPNFPEKVAFTDTGSAKINNLSHFTDKSNEKNLGINENKENPQASTDILPKITENVDVSPQSAENSQSSTKNFEFYRDFFSEDSKSEFSKNFPDIDPSKLRNNREFCSLLELLRKNPTLSQIYACFNGIYLSAASNAEEKLLHALANSNASVGALSSANSSTECYFTKEQVLKMSKEQIKANYSQIRNSQKHW